MEECKLPKEFEERMRRMLADEFPIGWSKFAGGVFKNHYPRGLRRNN